jgi:hypothetical protein
LQPRICSNVAHDIKTLDGQTPPPKTLMTSKTADISLLCEFEWFQWLWYRNTKAAYPNDSKLLVWYLGLAKSIGLEMCMHVFKSIGCIVQCTTIGPIMPALDLPLRDAMANATVIARKCDSKDNPIGQSHTNPLLDTRVYDVKFPNGSIVEFVVNLIAKTCMCR